ncbi:hypothetical protein CYMTET_6765 [Cymbomonas tetramitiformis]|uniref:EF-hand domain-containing protein n=1 Tax=Cymbomonas tetramitiformis TaxID=36881 RepID=A0AAE0LI36_9CHLO|nr:hypothetical protein CYMTET_6765 [Cymbomonas tetramitiformis]|eukprot:gene19735-23609_t
MPPLHTTRAVIDRTSSVREQPMMLGEEDSILGPPTLPGQVKSEETEKEAPNSRPAVKKGKTKLKLNVGIGIYEETKAYGSSLFKRDKRLIKFVESKYFVNFMGFLILLTSIIIGLDVDYKIMEHELLQQVDWLIVFIFLLEALLKICAYGKFYFTSPQERKWNIFDLSVVLFSLVEGVISQYMNSENAILRLVKLSRIFRVVRLLNFSSALSSLVTAGRAAVISCLWVVVMMLLLFYIYAVGITIMIGHSDTFQEDEYVATYYGTIPRTLATLFQVATLDSWSAQPRYIQSKADNFFSVNVWLLYVVFIFTASMMMLNLLNAVFVESILSVMAQQKADEAVVKKMDMDHVQSELSKLFNQMDADKDGTLTKAEFKEAAVDPHVSNLLVKLGCDPDDFEGDEDDPGSMTMWDLLDSNDDGKISYTEFIKFVVTMNEPASKSDVRTVLKQLNFLERKSAKQNKLLVSLLTQNKQLIASLTRKK